MFVMKFHVNLVRRFYKWIKLNKTLQVVYLFEDILSFFNTSLS